MRLRQTSDPDSPARDIGPYAGVCHPGYTDLTEARIARIRLIVLKLKGQ